MAHISSLKYTLLYSSFLISHFSRSYWTLSVYFHPLAEQ
jgi:hypothetical protein